MGHFACVLAVLLTCSACHSFRAMATPVREQALVRVRFDPPGEVDFASPDGGTRRLTDVTAIEGRVVAWRGDTLQVAVRSVRTSVRTHAASVRPGTTAAVAPGPGRFTEQRQLSVRRTALAVGGVSVTAVALFSLLILLAYGTNT
jgi:hypothetical protein